MNQPWNRNEGLSVSQLLANLHSSFLVHFHKRPLHHRTHYDQVAFSSLRSLNHIILTMTVFLKNLNLDLIKPKLRGTKKSKKVKAKAKTSAQASSGAFPRKLYQMLKETEEQGLDHIVSWQHDGQSFKVHKPDRFVDNILPKYLRCSKMKSFQRQLNFYMFQRVVEGPLEGSYKHPHFIKGGEKLAGTIRRLRDPTAMESETSSKRTTESTPIVITNDEASTSENDEPRSDTKDISEVLPSPRNPRRDSLQVFLEANFGNVEHDRGLRESFREGKRFSFVGKNFFFLPVEFTDLGEV